MINLFLLLFVVSSMNGYSFDWQGHRGARGIYPENTIGAMILALKYPVTTLELDVVISKDQQVVVSHEPWMNPDICKSPTGKEFKERDFNLYQMPYSEIQMFDCGSKNYSRFPEQQKIVVGKPLLSTLLRDVEKMVPKNREITYSIEIKSTEDDEKRHFQPDYKLFSDLVVKEILRTIPVNRFYIQSFDWRVLKYIKLNHPKIKLVALREEPYTPHQVIKDLGFLPEVFSPDFKLLNFKDITTFHELGVKVIPWTVNSVQEMETLINMKVDGIITDYPNLIPSVNLKKCKDGFNFFENRCVKIPENALPSHQNPGWLCKPFYVQKRGHCVKISLPKNAHFLEDGKTWQCDEGHRRYRDRCQKY
ncbi:MAG: glycerophosphodiester phosphodiesterase family protein [Bacteriovoracaceae bacterium]